MNFYSPSLGHKSTTTTHRFVEADLAMKDKTLARLQEFDTKMCRHYSLDDVLMQFHIVTIGTSRSAQPLVAQGPARDVVQYT